jgi:hypothetical protein
MRAIAILGHRFIYNSSVNYSTLSNLKTRTSNIAKFPFHPLVKNHNIFTPAHLRMILSVVKPIWTLFCLQ